MKLHPFMVEALYLRQNPGDVIAKPDGKLIWYSPSTDKYYWQNPRTKTRNGVYEARGLMEWWRSYLNLLEREMCEFTDDCCCPLCLGRQDEELTEEEKGRLPF